MTVLFLIAQLSLGQVAATLGTKPDTSKTVYTSKDVKAGDTRETAATVCRQYGDVPRDPYHVGSGVVMDESLDHAKCQGMFGHYLDNVERIDYLRDMLGDYDVLTNGKGPVLPSAQRDVARFTVELEKLIAENAAYERTYPSFARVFPKKSKEDK